MAAIALPSWRATGSALLPGCRQLPITPSPRFFFVRLITPLHVIVVLSITRESNTGQSPRVEVMCLALKASRARSTLLWSIVPWSGQAGSLRYCFPLKAAASRAVVMF